MSKENWKKNALFGMACGLLLASQVEAGTSVIEENVDHDAENMGYHLMTKEELFQHLNASSRKLFESLPPEAQELTLKVASARCNQTNECAGLNGCATEEHDCAGKGSCKNTSKCAISNKNLAVKLVANKFQKKSQNGKNQ